MSRSSSTTTGSGRVRSLPNCGRRRASSGSAAEYFRYALVKRIAGRSLAVVVHNAAAAAICAPARARGRDPRNTSPVEGASAGSRLRNRTAASRAGHSPGRVFVRRFRLPARVQASRKRAGRPRPRAPGTAGRLPADRGANSFRAISSALSSQNCGRPASYGSPSSRTGNSGKPRRPWMPASTFATPPPARLPESPCG